MSRFVSAGTTGGEEPPTTASTTERDEAWQKAQQQIESVRQATSAQKPRPGEQEGGKSLYETLQANKAAKQDAFEEANRLRNQFWSLDDDEVEFLDSVMESTRAREAEVRRETTASLEAFRQQREAAEKAAREGQGGGDVEAVGVLEGAWAAGPRKRKKGREGVLGGVKVRRTSTAEKGDGMPGAASPEARSPQAGSPAAPERNASGERALETSSPANAPETKQPLQSAPPKPTAAAGLGLVAYSSDEDDE